jgi:hypothetical protein
MKKKHDGMRKKDKKGNESLREKLASLEGQV